MSESRKAAELFLLLAVFWQAPSERFFSELADGSLDVEMACLWAQAGYPPAYLKSGPFSYQAPPLSALQSFFTCHFDGAGKDAVLPIESLYKRWTEDPTVRLPIAGSTGYLMGDAAMHMQYLLDSYGLSAPQVYRMMPDHLVLLLELAAYLLENRPPEEANLFVSQHFDWLDSLAHSLSELRLDGESEKQAQKFYQMALQALQKAVTCELTREINSSK